MSEFEETGALEKREAVDRIEGRQNLRVIRDLRGAKRGDHDEPEHQHRPEHDADSGGALELNGEQRS